MTSPVKITALPSRYEPLVGAFGEKARMTFVPPDADLAVMKKFLAAADSARQGKLLFLSGESGAGKSTFVHSLEIFLPETVGAVVRLASWGFGRLLDTNPSWESADDWVDLRGA